MQQRRVRVACGGPDPCWCLALFCPTAASPLCSWPPPLPGDTQLPGLPQQGEAQPIVRNRLRDNRMVHTLCVSCLLGHELSARRARPALPASLSSWPRLVLPPFIEAFRNPFPPQTAKGMSVQLCKATECNVKPFAAVSGRFVPHCVVPMVLGIWANARPPPVHPDRGPHELGLRAATSTPLRGVWLPLPDSHVTVDCRQPGPWGRARGCRLLGGTSRNAPRRSPRHILEHSLNQTQLLSS